MRNPICVVVAALLGMLAFAAVPATATTYHIKSCMKETEECKTSTVGSEFEITSKEFVLEAEGKVEDKCNVTLKGKVVDATTEKSGDEMEMSITSAKFTECTNGAVEANGLPWKEAVDATEYESAGSIEIPMKFTRNGCLYEVTNIVDTVLQFVINKPGSTEIIDKGAVARFTGSCKSLLTVFQRDFVRLLGDANLPGADNLMIG
jgi:hypothetical protein